MADNSNAARNKERASQEQRDIVIAQLKAENFELLHREKEQLSIQTKIVEMESRIGLTLKDKTHGLLKYKEEEEEQYSKLEKTKAYLSELNEDLNEKTKINKKLTTDIHSIKEMIEKRNIEVSKFTEQARTLDHQNATIESEIKQYLNEHKTLVDRNSILKLEISKINKNVNNVEERRITQKGKIKTLENETSNANSQLKKEQNAYNELTEISKKKQHMLDMLREKRKQNQMQYDTLNETNMLLAIQLKQKNRTIQERQKTYQELSNKLNSLKESNAQKTADITHIGELIQNVNKNSLLLKEKLIQISADLKVVEEINTKSQNEKSQLIDERSNSLQQINYISDKLNSIRNVIKCKDNEIKDCTQVYQQIDKDCNDVIQQGIQFKDQIEALRNHVALLESQNNTLNGELDNVIETDEIIRRDLSRKEQIASMQKSSSQMIENSLKKVHQSKSPPHK